jgi:hypothetical protein
MIRGVLLDEHLPRWWRRALVQGGVVTPVWRVGEAGTPPLQSPDPLLLHWCERNDSILLTNNRHSMPQHLADHMTQGRHVQGIFVVDPGAMEISVLAENLILILEASFENEYRDQIHFLPIT